MQTDTINVFIGNVTISNPSDINGSIRDAVLLVDGNITFEDFPGGSDVFNNAGRSIALIVTGSINIHSDIDQINAILIGESVNFAFDIASGSTTPNPLKIVGNVISHQPVTKLKRERSDLERPSVFIVVSPKMYMDLWTKLSQITLRGRQIQ